MGGPARRAAPGDGAGIACPARSRVRVAGLRHPGRGRRATRWTPERHAPGWGVRLGLHLVKGIGEQHEALLDAELARGPYRSLADVVERTGLPEEVIERLIRAGALDSLGRPRRELLWQLREVAGASRGRVDGRTLRALGRAAGKRGAAAGRPLDLRLPATEAPALPPLTESERLGDAYAVIGLDARRQVVGAVPAGARPAGRGDQRGALGAPAGPVRIGGLVVTRQHPMTAQGHGLPGARGRDRDGQRHALAGHLGAAASASSGGTRCCSSTGTSSARARWSTWSPTTVRPLAEVAAAAGGPGRPDGVRQIGHAGMRRLG